MNPRVLELLKNPKHIQLEDLSILNEEINAFPYIQNIRALHLYGVHLFDKENYQKELSTTAAYTTDKKILYQLINGKIQQKNKPKPKAEEPIGKKNEALEEKEVKNKFHYVYKTSDFPLKRKEEELQHVSLGQDDIGANTSQISNETKSLDSLEEDFFVAGSCQVQNSSFVVNYIYVNGERNRVLFEGEEGFMNETITQNRVALETEDQIGSGEVVESVLHEQDQLNAAEEKGFLDEDREPQFTSETIVNEDHISSDEADEVIVEDPSELSFHAIDTFLPDVKIQSEHVEEDKKSDKIVQSGVHKHEEEMRRLIEEVEKKMKEAKTNFSVKDKEPDLSENTEISFAETQHFEVSSQEIKESIDKEIEKSAEEISEKTIADNQSFAEIEEPKSVWKPMSFESHTPDSLLDKNKLPVLQEVTSHIAEPSEKEKKYEEVARDEVLLISEEADELLLESKKPELQIEDSESPETLDEAENAVMNVSFFGSDISRWKPEEIVKDENQDEIASDTKEKKADNIASSALDHSNIPGFINTWQSWLKIGRVEEGEKQKEEVKIKAIENFIENNPKISQLKEESSFVVKEKNVDISHLMTETLANLYTEQKLYTKAIKAFEVLIEKHPSRKSYFETKIQEVKDIKTKN